MIFCLPFEQFDGSWFAVVFCYCFLFFLFFSSLCWSVSVRLLVGRYLTRSVKVSIGSWSHRSSCYHAPLVKPHYSFGVVLIFFFPSFLRFFQGLHLNLRWDAIHSRIFCIYFCSFFFVSFIKLPSSVGIKTETDKMWWVAFLSYGDLYIKRQDEWIRWSVLLLT